MSVLMDVFTAWIAMGLAFLLVAIYFTKRITVKSEHLQLKVKRITQFLRKQHKHMGIAIVIIGMVHGLLSSQNVFSWNLGTLAWLSSVVLGLNFMLRKHFSKRGGWMIYHRGLTILFVALIGLHIVDVGGIHIHEIVASEWTAWQEKKMKPREASIGQTFDTVKKKATSKSIPDRVEEKSQVPNEAAATKKPESQSKDNGPINLIKNEKKAVVKSIDPEKVSKSTTSVIKEQKSNQNPEPMASKASPDSTETVSSDSVLKDGTYIGVGKGYKEGLKVQVTIVDGKYSAIEILEHHEVGERYFSEAIDTLPGRIIEAQSLEVDTVTGATRTSEGILSAVKNALGL